MKNKKYSGVPLESFPLDENDNFCILAKTIDWELFSNTKEAFENGYAPMQPTRRVIAIIILGELLNKSGEELIKQWLMVPYYQYFTGESWFHWESPISASEIDDCKSQLSIITKKTIDEIIILNQSKFQVI